MAKARKKPTITLEISKELFSGDTVHLLIKDKDIAVNGTISDNFLNKTIGERKDTLFILLRVSDQQIANIKEQLSLIVKPNNIKEAGKMLFTDIESRTNYQRLKAVIVYKNTIFQVNNLSIFKKEDGSNSIVFRIVQ